VAPGGRTATHTESNSLLRSSGFSRKASISQGTARKPQQFRWHS
jgi:hypothetical protein